MNENNNFSKFEQNKPKNPINFNIWEACLASLMLLVVGQILGSIVTLPTMFYKDFNHIAIPLGYAVAFLSGLFLIALWRQISLQQLFSLFKALPNLVYLCLSVLLLFMLLPSVELATSIVPTSGGPNNIIGKFYDVFTELFQSMFQYKIAAIVTVSLLAPIIEEWIFRGVILEGMLNKKVNPWLAIVVSSILFGVVHLNPWQFMAATLLGVCFGFVYWRTRQLWICIILHAINNALASFLLLKYDNMESIKVSEIVFDNQTTMIALGGIVASIVIGYLLYMVSKKKTLA